MHKIVDSTKAPHLIPRFREWVESEWGNVDSFENSAAGVQLPAPLLALEQQQLLGGLSFTCHAKPNAKTKTKTKTTGIWINTLYVAPEYRNRGIAAELLEAAQVAATKLSIEELYVFTDLPNIYERRGWKVVRSVKESKVLNKHLPD